MFVNTPLTPSKRGNISPRCFHDYDDSERDGYDASVFESSVMNSFPDTRRRINFLNKFYQCLLFKQLPQKTSKLVAWGDSNSGKTSWAQVFFGLLGEKKIASIAKEKTFPFSMVNETTELVLLDEWNEKLLASDSCKTFFQGGRMLQSVKYQNAQALEMDKGVFTTCNLIPDFGPEQQNVMNRLALFQTIALAEMDPNAPKWIRDNAMQCLVWIANQINTFVNLLPLEERFYEKHADEHVHIIDNDVLPAEELQALRNVSDGSNSVQDAFVMPPFPIRFNPPPPPSSPPTIPETPANSQPSPSLFPSGSSQVAGPSNYRPPVKPAVKENVANTDESEPLLWLERLKRVDCMNVPAQECNPAESDCDEFDIGLPKRLTNDDINTKAYFREVKRLINNYLDIGVIALKTQAHWKMFILKRSYKKGKAYKLPDPLYDAWMCVTGEKRDVFKAKEFVTQYPSIKLYLKEIRKLCNIHMPFKDVGNLASQMVVSQLNTPSPSCQKQKLTANIAKTEPKYIDSPAPTRLTTKYTTRGAALIYKVRRQMNPSFEKWL